MKSLIAREVKTAFQQSMKTKCPSLLPMLYVMKIKTIAVREKVKKPEILFRAQLMKKSEMGINLDRYQSVGVCDVITIEGSESRGQGCIV